MAGHDKLTASGKKFFKEVEELKKLDLSVGFQHGENTTDDGVDIADVALWNEVGTANIQPRPFLRQSVDNNTAKINSMCKAQVKGIASGQKTAKDALQALGVMQKALIQSSIRDGDFTPNADATIEKKGSDKPLIDSGQMRQSVNFTIKAKGG